MRALLLAALDVARYRHLIFCSSCAFIVFSFCGHCLCGICWLVGFTGWRTLRKPQRFSATMPNAAFYRLRTTCISLLYGGGRNVSVSGRSLGRRAGRITRLFAFQRCGLITTVW